MRKAIDEDTLRALIETAAVREIQCTRGPNGAGFALSARLGTLVTYQKQTRAFADLGLVDGCRAFLYEAWN